MLNELKDYFTGKKLLILGFGVEGESTYKLLRTLFPDDILHIADIKESITSNEIISADRDKIILHTGSDYLKNIKDFDIVIKTPGISLKYLAGADFTKFTSHTDIFIRFFKRQIIGVTGTKGKSTTSSLIWHIIKSFDQNCLLVGNIGMPPFDFLDQINKHTKIVYELSSHQLEQITVSPHVAVMLNLYEEHLDHYKSFEKYQKAKLNIAINQDPDDYFIFNEDDVRIRTMINDNPLKSKLAGFSIQHWVEKGCYVKNGKVNYTEYLEEEVLDKTQFTNLIGEHNLMNIMAAACASIVSGVPAHYIREAVETFKSLEHRIELVGKFDDVIFYNDSISTIPEATIAAVKALGIVDTLILGGLDRGISYDALINFINGSKLRNLVFIGEAGKRMLALYEKIGLSGKNTFYSTDFSEAVQYAKSCTGKNMICLLSPAASSYDMFRNFAERGAKYKQLVRK